MKSETKKRDVTQNMYSPTDFDRNLSSELVEMSAWVPEAMGPGHLLLLRNRHELTLESGPHSFWAVLACPQCGTFGLITERQYVGEHSVLCGNQFCGCHFFIEERSRFEFAPVH